MSTKTVFTILVVFLLASITATTERTSALSAFVSTASGEGTFLFQQEEWAFSFSATVNGSSTSGKGTAQFDNLSAQTSVSVKINCVKIAGAEAVISGKVVDTTDSDYPKNSNVLFGMIDGSLSPIPFFADRITPLFVRNPGINCNDGLPLPQLVPEEGGLVITL
jgi:hypothetical protein